MPDQVKAEIWNDRIRLEASFFDKDLSMQVPGARWNREELFCHVPLTWASCKQLRGIFEERLEIGDNLYKWAFEEIQSRVNPCMNLRQAIKGSGSIELCDGLYPFQQAGAEFLILAEQAILADLMGSGKTIQAIAAARAIEERNYEGREGSLPALIVCPQSMKRTWATEIEKWWPGVPTYIVDGTKKKRSEKILACNENPGIVIINWESVRLHSRLSPYGSIALSPEDRTPKELNQIPFRLIIADEAHRMKDPTSKQTRAVWNVGHNPSVEYRWALTGTPLTNTPETLFPILHFLHPTEHPSKIAFINRYCDSAPSRWGPGLDIFGLKESTKEEFFEIFDPRFRRMPKEVVLPNLPPIQRIRKYVQMGDEQRRSYRDMAEEMVAVDEEGNLIIAVNPVSKLTRLIQYSSASILMVEDNIQNADGTRNQKAKLTDPSCKLDQLMIDLGDYLEAEESVVVFAVSRQLIEMAEERLKKKKISYSVIKGNQTADFRQKQIDDFQARKVPVILVVIAAGGTGITLTAARIAIFLQRSYSYVDQAQAEARVHRIGSEKHDSILIVDYLTEGTIETHVCDMLEGKAEQLEAIVRDREAIRRMLYGGSNES